MLGGQNVGYSNFSQPQSHLSFCVLLQYLVERRRVVTQLGRSEERRVGKESLTRRLRFRKHLEHSLGNLLLLGMIGVLHNRRNASSRLLLLISKHLILCIYFFQAEDGIRRRSRHSC